jgi:hypothetical protein
MRSTLATTLASLLFLGLTATASRAQQQTLEPIRPANTGAYVPPPATDEGTWDGTWYYESRDARAALWIRSAGDKVDVKMRYHSTQNSEAFLTDWDGTVKYQVRGRPAEFELDLAETTPDVLRGSWTWEVQGDQARKETAKVSIFRNGDGRRLTVMFEEYLRVLQVGEREMHITAPHGWTFLKASKRHVLWEEIPF